MEPAFRTRARPSKLDPFADKLSAWLKAEARKSRKKRRTLKHLHADLVALGYTGFCNRVAAFARQWQAGRQREEQSAGRGTFVPLVFQPGEAVQFNRSEDWATIAGENTKLQIAHDPSCRTAGRSRLAGLSTADACDAVRRALARVPGVRRGARAGHLRQHEDRLLISAEN